MDRFPELEEKSQKYDAKYKVDVPKVKDAVGIRATLNNMGFSNSDIGYDDKSGNVTLKGRALIKPGYIDEDAGVSYAKSSDIQKSLVDYYKGSENPIVRVSDSYASVAGEYGLGADALSYGNGTVSIGGMPLDILYIDDSGKAWAWQNDVRGLVNKYAKSTGVESPIDLADRYADKYLSDIRERLDDINDREAFSYNPDEDPVFLAYKNKYLTEGDRASRNAMADYSALTGGYTNSAAVTAGAMANQYYAQKLSDTIPSLAEQAYQRYYDKYMSELEVVDKLLDVYNAEYKAMADANETARDNANYSAAATTARDEAAAEAEQAEYERYWSDLFNPVKLEGEILDNTQAQIYNEYYRRLIEAEIEGKQLSNQKARIELGY